MFSPSSKAYLQLLCIISTDEDPSLRIESSAIINYVVFPQSLTSLLTILLSCLRRRPPQTAQQQWRTKFS